MRKKGFLTTSLATVLLYFGVVLLIIVFFFIFKLSKGDTTVRIDSYASDTEKNYRLLNFLRTPIEVDGTMMNTAELIALYKEDDSKKGIFKQNLDQFIKDFYGEEKCSVVFIDGEKFSSTGFKGRLHSCPIESIKITGYSGKPIGIVFDPDALALSYVDIRVGRVPE